MSSRSCQQCKSRMVRLAPPRAIGETLLRLVTIYPVSCQVCGHRALSFWGRYAFLPQRSFSRVPVKYAAWFRPVEDALADLGHAGTVTDLSIGGCRLLGPSRLPIDTRLRLEFEVAEDEAPIAVQEAVVCWHPRGGMGLVFTRVRPGERRRIGRIMHARLSSAWPAMYARSRTGR